MRVGPQSRSVDSKAERFEFFAGDHSLSNHSPARSIRATPARSAETSKDILQATPVPIHTHISREGTITLTFGPDDAEVGLDIARKSMLATPTRTSANDSDNDSDSLEQHDGSLVESNNARASTGVTVKDTEASQRYVQVDVTSGRRQRKQKENTRSGRLQKQPKNDFYALLSGNKRAPVV